MARLLVGLVDAQGPALAFLRRLAGVDPDPAAGDGVEPSLSVLCRLADGDGSGVHGMHEFRRAVRQYLTGVLDVADADIQKLGSFCLCGSCANLRTYSVRSLSVFQRGNPSRHHCPLALVKVAAVALDPDPRPATPKGRRCASWAAIAFGYHGTHSGERVEMVTVPKEPAPYGCRRARGLRRAIKGQICPLLRLPTRAGTAVRVGTRPRQSARPYGRLWRS